MPCSTRRKVKVLSKVVECLVNHAGKRNSVKTPGNPYKSRRFEALDAFLLSGVHVQLN